MFPRIRNVVWHCICQARADRCNLRAFPCQSSPCFYFLEASSLKDDPYLPEDFTKGLYSGCPSRLPSQLGPKHWSGCWIQLSLPHWEPSEPMGCWKRSLLWSKSLPWFAESLTTARENFSLRAPSVEDALVQPSFLLHTRPLQVTEAFQGSNSFLGITHTCGARKPRQAACSQFMLLWPLNRKLQELSWKPHKSLAGPLNLYQAQRAMVSSPIHWKSRSWKILSFFCTIRPFSFWGDGLFVFFFCTQGNAFTVFGLYTLEECSLPLTLESVLWQRSRTWLFFEHTTINFPCHIFFIPSSDDGQSGCFHVLAMVNRVVMNILVHDSFSIMVFSQYMRSSGIAGS